MTGETTQGLLLFGQALSGDNGMDYNSESSIIAPLSSEPWIALPTNCCKHPASVVLMDPPSLSGAVKGSTTACRMTTLAPAVPPSTTRRFLDLSYFYKSISKIFEHLPSKVDI